MKNNYDNSDSDRLLIVKTIQHTYNIQYIEMEFINNISVVILENLHIDISSLSSANDLHQFY